MMETSTGQQAMTPPKPQKEHRWLQKFVGEWTYEGEAPMAPDQPPAKFSGSEKLHPLGELWVSGESQGITSGGSPETSLLTLGYDPDKRRFVGTWLGSMMTYLWVYDGELDASETTLTLNAEGPSMSDDGKMAKYRDVHEFKSADHRVLTSHMLGEDGKWRQFMEMHYHRK
jgi:hypothetical protein